MPKKIWGSLLVLMSRVTWTTKDVEANPVACADMLNRYSMQIEELLTEIADLEKVINLIDSKCPRTKTKRGYSGLTISEAAKMQLGLSDTVKTK